MLHRPVQYFLQSMLEEVTWENIAFPLQNKTDRYCTQPMSEIITPLIRVFNNLRWKS